MPGPNNDDIYDTANIGPQTAIKTDITSLHNNVRNHNAQTCKTVADVTCKPKYSLIRLYLEHMPTQR